MKASCLLICSLLAVFFDLSAQTLLTREYFAIPDNISLQRFTAYNIGELDLHQSNDSAVWNLANLQFESLNIVYELQSLTDTNPLFKNSTFTVTARENGSERSSFELYSITEGVLLFRGIGTFDEMGSRDVQLFDNPLLVLRFPWIVGESFYSENIQKTGTKTLQAIGTLLLPQSSPKKTYKFTEEYRDDIFRYVEHTWYADSIPYPVLIIQEQFHDKDSTALSRTVDILKNQSTVSVHEKKYFSDEETLLPVWHNNMLHLPNNYTLYALYSLKGESIPFTETMPGVYQVLHPSRAMFILFADSQKRIHSHFLPVIQ